MFEILRSRFKRYTAANQPRLCTKLITTKLVVLKIDKISDVKELSDWETALYLPYSRRYQSQLAQFLRLLKHQNYKTIKGSIIIS